MELKCFQNPQIFATNPQSFYRAIHLRPGLVHFSKNSKNNVQNFEKIRKKFYYTICTFGLFLFLVLKRPLLRYNT
jgi:hypothetical protein